MIVLAVVLSLLVALFCWPFRLVASPGSILRVVDDSGNPLVGLRVTRQWDTSEAQKGEDQATTDIKGEVRFGRVEFRMSQLKRIAKPLLMFVPSACGPGWEVYGHAEFDIYWPEGYALKFDPAEWKKVYAAYENHDGIHIYDPLQSSDKTYMGLYVFNKREDFEYTVTLFERDRK